MFERFLSRLLVERFGRFVDGLDRENVNVGVLRGEVLLQDLTVRLGEATDAVPELTREWPLRVSFGRIGTFRLCVPWRRLFRPGAPLELVLEDVHIVFSPLEDAGAAGTDERQVREWAHAAKRARVRRLLHERLGAASDESATSPGEAENGSMWERLSATLFEVRRVARASARALARFRALPSSRVRARARRASR